MGLASRESVNDPWATKTATCIASPSSRVAASVAALMLRGSTLARHESYAVMAAAVADCAERPFTMSDVSSCAPAAQRQSGNSAAICLQATHACERRHLRMAQLGELVNQWLEEVNAGHQTPVNGSIEATQDVSHAIYSGLQAVHKA